MSDSTTAALAQIADPDLRDRATEAATSRDPKLLSNVGGRLERRGHFKLAWQFLADASMHKALEGPSEWNGDWRAQGGVLVHRRMRHTGAELRMARFLADAAGRGLDIIAWIEPRLVPLFRRSLPGVRFASRTEPPPTTAHAASYERIGQHALASDDELRPGFRPLVPDAVLVRRLVGTVGGPDRTRIGIAWHSTNQRKDLPGQDGWATFMDSVDADFVCLQYQPETFGLADLRERSSAALHHVDAIDQMADLDAFAALVAATDVVVTISNTTAHMAGALGKRCFVILDDKDHLIWPETGSDTPFYPSLTLIRPAGRPWQTVFGEVRARLAEGRTGHGRPAYGR